MAKPGQALPVQTPAGFTHPQDIIDSLHQKPPVKLTIHPAGPMPDVSPAVLPLRWEEMIPTTADMREFGLKAALGLASVAVALGLWTVLLRTTSIERARPRQIALPTTPVHFPTLPLKYVPEAREALEPTAIESLHPAAPRNLRPAKPAPTNAYTPESIKARFYSPSMIELNWELVGDNYTYRLYAADTPTMTDAQLLTEDPIVTPYLAWTPGPDIEATWLAVTSVDQNGAESAFSRPMRIRVR